MSFLKEDTVGKGPKGAWMVLAVVGVLLFAGGASAAVEWVQTGLNAQQLEEKCGVLADLDSIHNADSVNCLVYRVVQHIQTSKGVSMGGNAQIYYQTSGVKEEWSNDSIGIWHSFFDTLMTGWNDDSWRSTESADSVYLGDSTFVFPSGPDAGDRFVFVPANGDDSTYSFTVKVSAVGWVQGERVKADSVVQTLMTIRAAAAVQALGFATVQVNGWEDSWTAVAGDSILLRVQAVLDSVKLKNGENSTSGAGGITFAWEAIKWKGGEISETEGDSLVKLTQFSSASTFKVPVDIASGQDSVAFVLHLKNTILNATDNSYSVYDSVHVGPTFILWKLEPAAGAFTNSKVAIAGFADQSFFNNNNKFSTPDSIRDKWDLKIIAEAGSEIGDSTVKRTVGWFVSKNEATSNGVFWGDSTIISGKGSNNDSVSFTYVGDNKTSETKIEWVYARFRDYVASSTPYGKREGLMTTKDSVFAKSVRIVTVKHDSTNYLARKAAQSLDSVLGLGAKSTPSFLQTAAGLGLDSVGVIGWIVTEIADINGWRADSTFTYTETDASGSSITDSVKITEIAQIEYKKPVINGDNGYFKYTITVSTANTNTTLAGSSDTTIGPFQVDINSATAALGFKSLAIDGWDSTWIIVPGDNVEFVATAVLDSVKLANGTKSGRGVGMITYSWGKVKWSSGAPSTMPGDSTFPIAIGTKYKIPTDSLKDPTMFFVKVTNTIADSVKSPDFAASVDSSTISEGNSAVAPVVFIRRIAKKPDFDSLMIVKGGSANPNLIGLDSVRNNQILNITAIVKPLSDGSGIDRVIKWYIGSRPDSLGAFMADSVIKGSSSAITYAYRGHNTGSSDSIEYLWARVVDSVKSTVTGSTNASVQDSLFSKSVRIVTIGTTDSGTTDSTNYFACKAAAQSLIEFLGSGAKPSPSFLQTAGLNSDKVIGWIVDTLVANGWGADSTFTYTGTNASGESITKTVKITDIAGIEFEAPVINGDDGSFLYTITVSAGSSSTTVDSLRVNIKSATEALGFRTLELSGWNPNWIIVPGDSVEFVATAVLDSVGNSNRGVGTITYSWGRVRWSSGAPGTTKSDSTLDIARTANYRIPTDSLTDSTMFFVKVTNTISDSSVGFAAKVDSVTNSGVVFIRRLANKPDFDSLKIVKGNNPNLIGLDSVRNNQNLNITAGVKPLSGGSGSVKRVIKWYIGSSSSTLGAFVRDSVISITNSAITYAYKGHNTGSSDSIEYLWAQVVDSVRSTVPNSTKASVQDSLFSNPVRIVTVPQIHAASPASAVKKVAIIDSIASNGVKWENASGKVVVGGVIRIGLDITYSSALDSVYYRVYKTENPGDTSGGAYVRTKSLSAVESHPDSVNIKARDTEGQENYYVRIINKIRTANYVGDGGRQADSVAIALSPVYVYDSTQASNPAQPRWSKITAVGCDADSIGALFYASKIKDNNLTLGGHCYAKGTIRNQADDADSVGGEATWYIPSNINGGADGLLELLSYSGNSPDKRVDKNVGEQFELKIKYTPRADKTKGGGETNPNLGTITKEDKVFINVKQNYSTRNDSSNIINKDLFDDAALVKWVGTAKTANGKSVEPPAAAGIKTAWSGKPTLSGIGNITYTFASVSGPSCVAASSLSASTCTRDWNYWDNAGPVDAGFYQLLVDFSNEDGLNVKGTSKSLDYGVFQIKNNSKDSTLFTTVRDTVEYSVGGGDAGYAFKWPASSVKSDVVDSVTVRSWDITSGKIWKAEQNTIGYNTNDVTKRRLKGEVDYENNKIVLYTNTAGVAELTLDIKGRDNKDNVWEAKGVKYTATVRPKKIDTTMVELHELVKVFYTSNVIQEDTLANAFDVFDGDNVLTRFRATSFGSKPWTSRPSLGPTDVVDYVIADTLAKQNRRAAGPATFRLIGLGNYRDSVTVNFTIERAPVKVELAVGGAVRTYDGTDGIDTVTVTRTQTPAKPYVLLKYPQVGIFATDTLKNVRDFVFSDVKYDSKDAGSRKLTATVTMVGGSKSKSVNYLFQKADGTLDSSIVLELSTDIQQLRAAKTDIDYTIPTHYYTGNPHDMGTPNLKGALAGETEVFLSFVKSGEDYTDVPSAQNTTGYKLYVNVKGTTNVKDTAIDFGTYKINVPLTVTFNTDLKDVSVREGQSVGLTVVPNPTRNIGDLVYEWYKFTTSAAPAIKDTLTAVKVAGWDGATFPAAGASKGDVNYYAVRVTNVNPEVQINQTSWSKIAKVTVIEPARVITQSNTSVNLVEANVAKKAVYSGKAIELVKGTDLTVTYTLDDGSTVAVATDQYRLDYVNNVNAGTATVFVYGLSGEPISATNATKYLYSGSAFATFEIAKADPTNTQGKDFSWVASRFYNGRVAEGANVTAASTVSGLGTITVKYNSEAAVPQNVGQYTLTVSTAGGTNYTDVTDFSLGQYQITKKQPVPADFDYAPIPTNHFLNQTAPLGIGTVTLPGAAEGSYTLLYDGKEAPATWAAKTYKVTVSVKGDNNFIGTIVTLGDYKINATGVLESDRVVPGTSAPEVAAVAPVKTVAAAFSAGPSPASKAAGKIAFFSSKNVKSGTVQIFDVTGKTVAKIKVASKSGSAEIGSWNLRDKKGAHVAEGTYAIKGTLAGKDGTKEKVSFLFNVVQ